MELDEAHALISRAVGAGHTAHGYLIVGDISGNAGELVERTLALLFPDASRDENGRIAHPDVVRLEPEGKSRQIPVDSMRERIVEPMSQTAFSGGWKVGVVVGADRLNAQSANAFLKSLEEPTPKTMYLLVTDRPDTILPTIVSRCQRIDLPLSKGELEGEAHSAVVEVFASRGLVGIAEKGSAARHLTAILKGLKEEVPDEESGLVRKAFFKTILGCVRGWMVDGLLPRHQAFANVELVEKAYVHCDRNNIPEETAICNLLDRLTFPA